MIGRHRSSAHQGLLIGLAVFAVALVGCGQSVDRAPEDITSAKELAELEALTNEFDSVAYSVSQQAQSCDAQVDAGIYPDYDQCFFAEVKPIQDQAEVDGKRRLSSLIWVVGPKCESALERLNAMDWGPGTFSGYMRERYDGARLLEICRTTR